MASRRRVGPSAAPLFHDDEDDAAVNSSLCRCGQLLSGAVFAFLFGSLGLVFSGDAWPPSVLWVIGLVIGATLGVHAVRPQPRDSDDTPWSPHPLAATTVGATTVGVLHFLLSAVVPYNLPLAGVATAAGAFAAQDLGTEEGRATARQRAQLLFAQALLWRRAGAAAVAADGAAGPGAAGASAPPAPQSAAEGQGDAGPS